MTRTSILIGLSGLSLLNACGGGGSGASATGGGSGSSSAGSGTPPSIPVPSISSLSPASATAGGAGFELVVSGANFSTTSEVEWNGSRLLTHYRTGQLAASITAADITAAGTAKITVVNSVSLGGTSSITSFTISNPVPAVNALVPASVLAGAAPTMLSINGSGFVAGSTVTYNGTVHAASNVGATQLTIELSTADQATVGAYPVVVSNASPGGGASSRVNFDVRSQSGGFQLTGNMLVERYQHTATLLLDRRVLIAGGLKLDPPLVATTFATAELFDANSGMFTEAAGSMTVPRSGHSATLLATTALAKVASYGKVLIVGGGGQTAELFDPVGGTFAATGSLRVARTGQTATLLTSGEVLVAGGGTDTAELYNPGSGRFTATTGTMTVARTGHTATLLQDGRVLLAGGTVAGGITTSTAELYDPATGLFTAAAGTMATPGSSATATLLPDGTVLIAGWYATGELFSPAARSFTPVGIQAIRSAHATANLLNNGTVLIAGGFTGRNSRPSALAQLFTPISRSFAETGGLNNARYGHSATLLADGRVLIAGGAYCSPPDPPVSIGACWSLSSAELYE